MSYSQIKKIFKFTTLGLVAFAMSSCTDFIKGKAENKEQTIEIKQAESMSCLKNVSLDFQKFMSSTSTDAEIDATFTCIDQTLNEVQTRVEGRADANAFNADELFDIFDQFIKDAHISHETTNDFLSLKAALLGGTPQRITKDEISALRDYLHLIKQEAKNLLPYAQLFKFQRANPVFSKDMIRDGFAQLNLSLKNLMRASHITHSSYSYEDLRKMIVNLHLLNENQESLLSLADKLNNMLTGSQAAANEEDRMAYIDSLTETLRLYETFVQGYVKFEISTPDRLEDLFTFIQDTVNLLENSLQFKKTNMISSETIDPLVSDMIEHNVFPLAISQETALSFYKTLLVRALESGPSGDILSFSGLKKIHLTNIRRELAIYRIFARFINNAAGPETMRRLNKTRIPIVDVQHQIMSFDPSQQQDILRPFNRDTQVLIIAAANELKQEFLDRVPTVYRDKKMVLTPNQQLADQNWDDLARALFLKMLSRELMIGWGNANASKLMRSSFISRAGMVTWYAEFKNFGIETKSFDPRVENAGATSVVAANLLTRAGNGDDKMDYRETVQNLGVLMSAGTTAKMISEGLERAHCNRPETDVFGYNWNNEDCLYENLHANYRYYFSNLPSLNTFLSRQNPQQFKDFMLNVMELGRKDAGNRGVRVETSDVRSLCTMLYFIESLFAAHDTNKNWNLSEAEIKTAYPKFKSFATDFAHSHSQSQLNDFSSWKGTLAGYSCYSVDDLIRESFVFMVYHGHTPQLSDLTILPCLRSKPLIQFSGEVDRRGIINTFKILKAVLGS